MSGGESIIWAMSQPGNGDSWEYHGLWAASWIPRMFFSCEKRLIKNVLLTKGLVVALAMYTHTEFLHL